MFNLCRLSREQIDAENVETSLWRRAQGKLAEIAVGESTKRTTLCFIDRRVGGGAVTRGASFDLHKAKKPAIPGDQVNVSWRGARGPAAGDNGISQAAQVEVGRVFAGMTGREMGRKLRIASTACGEPVETVQGPF